MSVNKVGVGKYYEDLNEGDVFETLGRTITETDIVNFVNTTGMIEVLFVDMDFVKNETPYGRRIAPGALAYTFAEGLVIQSGLIQHTGIAFLEMNLKVLNPIFCGDTIHARVTITGKRDTSKPGRGIVYAKNEVINQDGKVVLEYTPVRMIKKRNHS